jgi:NDP-sugar pyrophosphorylase family protein
MRAIRKCAIRYFLAKTLKMTKRVVLHRLSRTRQKIFRSLLFNAANWFKIALNFYEKKSIDDEIFEKYKIDDFESFLKRKNEFIKFTQLTNRQSRYLYRVLELKLKDLLTSNFTSKKSNAKQSNVVIDDQNIIIDKNVIIDKDVTINKNIITNKNVIDKDVVIENDDIIDKKIITSKVIIEKNAIKKIDTNRAKHFERDQTNNCDCRELDEIWKNDLQRHDRDVHENQNALFLFSSINYIIWMICNMHHTILKNVLEFKRS